MPEYKASSSITPGLDRISANLTEEEFREYQQLPDPRAVRVVGLDEVGQETSVEVQGEPEVLDLEAMGYTLHQLTWRLASDLQDDGHR